MLSCYYCTDKSLDVCIFARFKVNCKVMLLRNFANFRLVMNFKLVMSREKELRGALGHGLLDLCVNPSLGMAYVTNQEVHSFLFISFILLKTVARSENK